MILHFPGKRTTEKKIIILKEQNVSIHASGLILPVERVFFQYLIFTDFKLSFVSDSQQI